jgi:hypothetical protein
VSYGGNQSWFTGWNLAPYGCGAIAGADLLAYTAFSDRGTAGLRKAVDPHINGLTLGTPASYNWYHYVVEDMVDFNSSGHWLRTGIPPGAFRDSVNGYYTANGGAGGKLVGDRFRFNYSTDAVGDMLKKQLRDDKPTPWLHLNQGGAMVYYYESTTHILGSDRRIDLDRDGKPNDADYANRDLLERSKGFPFVSVGDDYYRLDGAERESTKNHYVVITEMLVDGFDGKTKVVFSSWGEKMVTELKDMRSGSFGGVYTIE